MYVLAATKLMVSIELPGARRECWIRFRADYRAWTWIYIIYEFPLTLCVRSMVMGKLLPLVFIIQDKKTKYFFETDVFRDSTERNRLTKEKSYKI